MTMNIPQKQPPPQPQQPHPLQISRGGTQYRNTTVLPTPIQHPPPSSDDTINNHNYNPNRIPIHKYCDKRRLRWPSRCSNHRILLLVILVVVSILFVRNLFFHPSTVVVEIHEDLYVVSHWMKDSTSTNNNNDDDNNETEIWNAYLTRLPPVPWPTETDGCYAEDGTRPYCQFHNLLIDLSLVNSASMGGESLLSNNDDNHNNNNHNQTREVMGQTEEDEYLVYQPGAFQLFTNRNTTLPTENVEPSFAYVNDVLNSLQVINVNDNDTPPDWNCTHYHPGTTLFLQRYEYVNLYHTLTDWWNTWTVYRYFRPKEFANVTMIFLDAHPAGNLDTVWTTLFGTSIHLRRMDDHDDNIHIPKHLCFERAILVPPGYISHLWPEPPPKGGMYDVRTYEMMNDFVDFTLKKLNLTHVHKIPGHVVMIDRKPYLAHARSQLVDDRSLNNLPEVADALLQNIPNVTSVRILQLHNMTFWEQVKAVREAEVLVGVHGAGLTHLVFMDRASHVVEFQMNLNFFVHLAQCKRASVTLHQIPYVSVRVPETFLRKYFLPTFAKIYGLNE